MQPIDPFVYTVAEFSKKLLTDYDSHEVLEELAEHLTNLLGLMGSGFSLGQDGKLIAITAVPPHLAPLERRQEIDQRGPCVHAFTTGAIVAVPDLSQETRWPEYSNLAAELGVRAVVGMPMTLEGQTVGSFNLFRATPGPWGENDLAAASVLLQLAAAFLINTSTLSKQTQMAEQLQRALDTRILLEQAKGVLAEAHSINVDQAFIQIRHYARDRNLKIRDVAHGVVHMGVRPT